jgi:hypothetical protein
MSESASELNKKESNNRNGGDKIQTRLMEMSVGGGVES